MFYKLLDSGLGFGVLRRSTTYIHVGVRWNDKYDVTPAKAGVHGMKNWIPVYTGMTKLCRVKLYCPKAF